MKSNQTLKVYNLFNSFNNVINYFSKDSYSSGNRHDMIIPSECVIHTFFKSNNNDNNNNNTIKKNINNDYKRETYENKNKRKSILSNDNCLSTIKRQKQKVKFIYEKISEYRFSIS